MNHACHRFWKCYKPLTLRSLLTRCTIPCAFHAKRQKVRDRQSLTLLTSKCASRHNGVHFFIISTSNSGLGPSVSYTFDFENASRHKGVQFFISHLPRWLHTRRFSEPTFRPSRATNHRKNTVFRDFATFSRTRIFCLLTRSVL